VSASHCRNDVGAEAGAFCAGLTGVEGDIDAAVFLFLVKFVASRGLLEGHVVGDDEGRVISLSSIFFNEW